MAKETGLSSVNLVDDDDPRVVDQLRERINKWVNLEKKIAALEEQLREERAEKRAIQEKYELMRRMGLQMGKGLTEIIEELVSGLLGVKVKEGEDDDGGAPSGIPNSLDILKGKILKWDFGEDDYQMLEVLKNLIKLFMEGRRRKMEEEDRGQSNEMGEDSSDDSMPVVHTLQMVQYKSEVDVDEGDDATSSPVEPLQVPPAGLGSPPPAGHPKDVDPDSDSSEDSDIAFLEEIPIRPAAPARTSKNFVLPKITSTFSVAASGSTNAKEIRGQFTSFSESENEDDDDDDDPRPSTSPMATQAKPPMLRRQRKVAMRRTGGFVPKIVKEEDTHSKVPRRSSRSPKPTPKMRTTLKKKRRRQRQRQAIQVQDNPNSPTGHCRSGYGSSPPPMKKNSQGPAALAAIFTKLPKLTLKLKPTPTKQLGKDSDSKHYLVDDVTLNGYHCACGIIRTTKSNLRAHIRRETNELKFKCPVCQLSFLFHSEQKMHLKSAHKIVGGGGGGNNSLFGCSFCGKVFCSEGQLQKHRATAHRGKGKDGEN